MNNPPPKDSERSRCLSPPTPSDSTHFAQKTPINERLYIDNLKNAQTIAQLNERIQQLTSRLFKSEQKLKWLLSELAVVREHAIRSVEKEYHRLKFNNVKIKKQNEEYAEQIKKLNRDLKQMLNYKSGATTISIPQKPRNPDYTEYSNEKSKVKSISRTNRVHTESSNPPNIHSPRTIKQTQPSQAFKTMESKVQSARLRLKASHIPCDQIVKINDLKFIFAQRTLSEDQLKSCFQLFPFQIRDKKLLAEIVRICMRDCQKIGKTLSGSLLRTVLTDYLGTYQIISEVEEINRLTAINQKIYDIGRKIISQLEVIASKKDYIPYRSFRDCLLNHDLSQQEIEFLVQKIILQSADIQHLNYHLISQVLDLYPEYSPT